MRPGTVINFGFGFQSNIIRPPRLCRTSSANRPSRCQARRRIRAGHKNGCHQRNGLTRPNLTRLPLDGAAAEQILAKSQTGFQFFLLCFASRLLVPLDVLAEFRKDNSRTESRGLVHTLRPGVRGRGVSLGINVQMSSLCSVVVLRITGRQCTTGTSKW